MAEFKVPADVFDLPRHFEEVAAKSPVDADVIVDAEYDTNEGLFVVRMKLKRA